MYWLLEENKQKEIRDKINHLVISLSEVNNKPCHKDQIFPFQGRKAIEHAKTVINILSPDGNSICDPFAGSGSFAYAAASLGKNVYANEYEPYTHRMAYTPFDLPNKNYLIESFQNFVSQIKPQIDYYYRTQCDCGEILPLDSLFFDRQPKRYNNISQHERLGIDGKNITYRGEYKCKKCNEQEKYFNDFDQAVLDSLEQIPDDKVFKVKLIENSRINLSREFLVYESLFPKRSRVVTSYIWKELKKFIIDDKSKLFIENTFLSILPLAKYKDYRSKSQDLHCPPEKLRETNILNSFIKQFNKRLETLYDYQLNSYPNINFGLMDFREYLSTLEQNSIDLFITDPPWHDGNAYFERAQFYHPWINFNLKKDKNRLSKEMIVSDSPERPDKHDKEQWWSDINDLFTNARRVLKIHSFMVLYFRPIPAKEWITNFNRLKLIARKNGFEPLLSIDLSNNDPAMRIQQSSHYAFSSDLILTFVKLKDNEKRIYFNNHDLDEISFKTAVELQDSLAGTFTRQEWQKAIHNKIEKLGLLELHSPKNKHYIDVSFQRTCETIDNINFLPKPSTPYSDEIFNTPYIERVSLYVPYIIEELLQNSDRFTFDKFLLKIAEFVENGTRAIIEDILTDKENSIYSLLNLYAEPLPGGKYFTKRPIPQIPSSIVHLLELNPYEFEAFIAKLLQLEGYKNVVVAGRAGDRGVDIRCNDKNGDLVIVQCKRYTKSKVSATPIQRLHSFGITRGATRKICITTTDYTVDGYDEAAKTGVETINREELERLVHKHNLIS